MKLDNIIATIIFAACVAIAISIASRKSEPNITPQVETPVGATAGSGSVTSAHNPPAVVFENIQVADVKPGVESAYSKPPVIDSPAPYTPPAQPPASRQAIPAATAGRYYSTCGPGGCSASGQRFQPFRRLFGRRR